MVDITGIVNQGQSITGNISQDRLEGILSGNFLNGDLFIPYLTSKFITTSGVLKNSVTGDITGSNKILMTDVNTITGVANGLATLDSTGKIPTSQMGSTVLTDTYVVNSEVEMLALVATKGDVAIRLDVVKSFILSASDPSVLGNWVEIISPGQVTSVNTLTGTVSLTTANIPENTNLYYTDARVISAIGATSTKNIYVSTTGSDTTGDGTIGLPFLTIQKGLNELVNYKTTVAKYLYIADGTYNGTFYIPDAMVGTLHIIGNSTTPDNVILDAQISSPIYGSINLLTHLNKSVKLYVDGLYFKNAGYSIYLNGSWCEIGYCKFYNFYTAIYSTNSYFSIPTGYLGNSTFDGNNVVGNCILLTSNSIGSITQNLVLTNIHTGYFSNSSILGISGTQSITLKSGGYGCIICRNKTYFTAYGTLNMNGTAIGSNLGIQLNDSISSITAGSTFNFTNLAYGINMNGMANWAEGNTCTYNYTNVTNKTYIQYSSTVSSINSLGTVLTFYKDFQAGFPTFLSYDERYMQYSTVNVNMYVTKTGSDTTGDGTLTKPFLTVQKAVTYAVRYNGSPSITINIGNGTYTENITIPGNLSGYVKFVGSGYANVIIASANTSTIIGHTIGRCKLFFDGITFSGATIAHAFYVNNNEVDFGCCKFYNNLRAFNTDENCTIYFLGGYSTSIIDGNNLVGGYAAVMTKNSTFRTYQSLTIQNVNAGLVATDGSNLLIYANVSISLYTASGSFECIILRYNSSMTLGVLGTETLTLAGQMNSTTRAIECTNSTISILSGFTINMTNFNTGWYCTGTYYITEGTTACTTTYTNVTTHIKKEYGGIIYSTNNLDATVILPFTFTGTQYGYDDRYMQYSAAAITKYVSATGSDTAGDGTVTYPYATILKACTSMQGIRGSVTKTIQLADGTYAGCVIPNDMQGSLLIQGNTTTPDNVIILGTNVTSDIGIQVNLASNCTVTFDGLKFSTFYRCIQNLGCEIHIKYCKFYNFARAIDFVSGRVIFDALVGYGGTCSFDGNSATTTCASIFGAGSGYLETNQSLTSVGTFNHIWLSQNNFWRNATSCNHTWTGGTQTSKIGMTARVGSIISSGACTFTLDGVDPTKTSTGIELGSNSAASWTANSTFTVSNCGAGHTIGGGTSWVEGSQCNFHYSGNTYNAKVSQLAYVDSKYQFGHLTGVVYYDIPTNGNPVYSGTDFRYGRWDEGDQRFYTHLTANMETVLTYPDVYHGYAEDELKDNSIYTFSVDINTISATADKRAGGTLTFKYYRYASGVITTIGTPTNTYEGDYTAQVIVSPTTNQILIQVDADISAKTSVTVRATRMNL